MRRSISGYSRFLLLSFSFCWLALYGGLPMMTLMGFSFCSWMRIQFSSDRPPRLKVPCRVTAPPVAPCCC